MKTILVIDDDPQFSKMVEQPLTMSGYEVLLADSGRQGIKIGQIHLPDLILSEVNMSNGDGYAVLTAVRGNCPTACLPFILLTAAPSSGGMLQGLSLSVDDYLPKPFTVPELLEEITAEFDSKQKKTQVRAAAARPRAPEILPAGPAPRSERASCRSRSG